MRESLGTDDPGIFGFAVPADGTPQSAALLRRCLYTLRMGRIDVAELLCCEALEAAPHSGSAWHLYGLLAAQGNRLDEAALRLSRALELAPDAAPILFDRATIERRRGKLTAALADYDRIVALLPADARAWHQRGLTLAELGLHAQALASHDRAALLEPRHGGIEAARGDALRLLGRAAEAIERYDRAIELAPDLCEAHNGRGLALAAIGRSAAALGCFARALALRPNYADALLNTGNVLCQMGRGEEALASFDRALEIAPMMIAALHGRAMMLSDLGRSEEALESYDRALAADPGLAAALVGKGIVLSHLDRRAEALAAFDAALKLVPDSAEVKLLRADVLEFLRQSFSKAEVHFLRGDTFRLLDRTSEAVAAYDEALALRPDFSEAWNNRGRALDALGEPEDALESYAKAARLRPDWAEPYANSSAVLRNLGRGEEAAAAADRALALDPHSHSAYNNRGIALLFLGRIDDALRSFDRALALRPDVPETQFNHAVTLLTAGDFERGWAEYDSRLQMDGAPRHGDAFARRPIWRGDEDIVGRTVALYAEQGYGDTLQFCRYVPLVAARGARVLLGAPPILATLLASLEGSPRIVSRSEAAGDFDFHCPLMSLPRAFRTTLETVPNKVPYLAPPAEHAARWRAKVAGSSRPRIGLAWSGNKAHRDDRNRSLALERLQPILSLGYSFFAVLRQLRPADMPVFAMHPNLHFFGPELRDFADTAALMNEMDLVISVDTASAHLAGALGRPVWVLLAFGADFRWMRHRADSPWYPTMRLFRQPRYGDWQSVIDRVCAALEAQFASGRQGSTPLDRDTRPAR